MPEEGVDLTPGEQLLSTDEVLRLVRQCACLLVYCWFKSDWVEAGAGGAAVEHR